MTHQYPGVEQNPLSVLVTGSAGFIGQHVVRHLAGLGHRVTALDFRPPGDPYPEGVEAVWCDIRSQSPPKRTFHAIVHLAALAGVRPSMDRPLEYETTNVLGTIRMLEFARQMAVPTFVFASSSSVYGRGGRLPFQESDHPVPASPYALTKLHGEQWGGLYAKLHGLRFVALRLFSVWGDGQRPDLALEAFRRRAAARQPVVIYGDGTQRRDLTHVSDVARAVALAISWEEPGQHIFNIGTGRNHSVLDMLACVSQLTNFTPEVEYQPANPADVPETLASPTKSMECLGWEPLVRFPEAP